MEEKLMDKLQLIDHTYHLLDVSMDLYQKANEYISL